MAQVTFLKSTALAALNAAISAARERGNHTGTQTQATIEGLTSALSDLTARDTPMYVSRAAALAAASGLPSGVTRIFVQEGAILVIRSRTAAADDPLYTTAPQWGVVMRLDVDALTPKRVPVAAGDSAALRTSTSWTVAQTFYNVQEANVTGTPLGTAVVSAQVDVLPAPQGVRQVWRMSNGDVYERTYNGTAWSAYVKTVTTRVTANVSAMSSALRNLDTLLSLDTSYTMDGSSVILGGPLGTASYNGSMHIRIAGSGLEQVLFLDGQRSPWVRNVSSTGVLGTWRRQAIGGVGKRLVVMGDSITAGLAASNTTRLSWVGRIAESYGAEVLKWGTAGAGMSPATSTNVTHIAGSFARRAASGAADLATANEVIVAFGTNDFNGNVPMGTLADSTETTFLGAMAVGLAAVRTANPGARVLFMLPTFRSVSASNAAENVSANTRGHTLADYRKAIIDFCMARKVEYIDAYGRAGVTAENVLSLTSDGLHPNDTLHARLAAIATGALLGMGDSEHRDYVARQAAAAERADRIADTAAIRAVSPATDVGRALIQYKEDKRIALGQRDDGLDFIPSLSVAQRIANALISIGFNPGSGGSGAAPAGGWAPSIVNDELVFTGKAGPGLIDRFRLRGTTWRPTPRKGRVLMGYGQSQSGIHQSGGEPVVWARPPVPNHILMLDDIQSGRGGLRGGLGQAPLRTATGLAPATTLVTTGGIQDIASAMAATLAYLDPEPQVYACRTEGRGGMPMIGTVPGQGIWRDSEGAQTQQFLNFIQSSNLMVQFMEAEGYTVEEITVLFDHGEADGQARGPASEYVTRFNGMAAEFEAAVSRPVHWLITQPASGEGPLADNDWPARLALYEIGGRPNATRVFAKYDLPIGNSPDGTADWVHTSYVGRVIQGEYYAHADAVRRSGKRWVAPWVTSVSVSGNVITANFDCDLPLKITPEDIFVRPERPAGVQMGGTGAPTVQSVVQTGLRQIAVTCSASPAGHRLRIGFTPRQSEGEYQRYPVGTTAIRDAWEQPSRWVSGVTLRRWAWGQEIQL